MGDDYLRGCTLSPHSLHVPQLQPRSSPLTHPSLWQPRLMRLVSLPPLLSTAASRVGCRWPCTLRAPRGGWGLKPGSVAVMFEQVRRIVVEQQLPILVFPEGTRDGTTTLKPFKKGMFDFAVQHRCHVLVMAIDGPQRCWPFPGPWFDSGEMRVALGPILPPATNAEQLMQSTRTAMQSLLEDMGAATPAQGQNGTSSAASKTSQPPSGAGTTIPSTSAAR